MTDLTDALDMVLAAQMRKTAAVLQLGAAAVEAKVKIRRFAEKFANGIKAGVDKTIAEHPDLAYANAQLDGYYGEPT